MSDFIYIVIVSTALWLSQVATAYELKTKEQLEELYEINSVLWAEGENTTARLKQCTRRKR